MVNRQNVESTKERRESGPYDPDFFARLEAHMQMEEQSKELEAQKFRENAERMNAIERDLQPLKKMYYAVVGSGAVMALLLGTLLYIYGEDKERLMAMQEILYKQGTAIEVLVNRAERVNVRLDKFEDRWDRMRSNQP